MVSCKADASVLMADDPLLILFLSLHQTLPVHGEGTFKKLYSPCAPHPPLPPASMLPVKVPRAGVKVPHSHIAHDDLCPNL